MYTYANGFRFAGRNDGSDVMLNFMQDLPIFNETSDVVDMGTEVVASVVMTRENILRLANSILQAFGTPPED